MRRGVAGLAVVIVLGGCGVASGRRPSTYDSRAGIEEGVASWYGPGFHGRRTSSGEVYDQNELTAAHRTLPLGTRVAVTNLANGRSVEVRINDRGPFVDGRSIDLSYAAAQSVGLVGPGTGRVRIQILGAGEPVITAATYAVQVGSFSDPANAEDLRRRLASRFDGVYVTRLDADRLRYYRVRIGPYEQRDSARVIADRVADLGFAAVIMEEGLARR
jgi:rare lipoprotein A